MKKATVTDTELIARTKAGELSAFESIVKKYEPQIAATVIGMLGNCQAADDVGQEVFIRLYKYLDKFREDASLGTYLTRIAINLSLNELKRRKRRQLLFTDTEDDIRDMTFEPNESMQQKEEQELVQKSIQKLDNNFRSVLVLRLIDGYSTAETAEILKIPVGTVLSRLARAQQKLKEHLVPIFKEEA